MKPLSLGYSPCPNDTFIFFPLVHGKVDTDGLTFREILEDVETLNQMARESRLDITKASFRAFGHLRDDYCLLHSGGALGKGCGPLVVAREELDVPDLRDKTIAIPGALTTAYLLLQIFAPAIGENIKIMPFNEIIGAVVRGEVDAGLIIHESRFTFEKAGLKKVIDLGDWWEKETGNPIPLGAILARRKLGPGLIDKIDRFIRSSVEYAFAHRDESLSYIKQHAQELQDDVINQHINLYVNEFSLEIGTEGERAVKELFRRAEERGIMNISRQPLFISY
ncbi:MAG TPA: 1,4-dihydroxy-6-naphthoate synthase [Candidatus Sulfobium mesophilum]|nr:1,4-dihydroxy-6-naphthoate synthase [Candidatus Sulfobium mesophilum]